MTRSLSSQVVVAALLAVMVVLVPLPAAGMTPAATLAFRLASFGLLVVALSAQGAWKDFGRAKVPVLSLAAIALWGGIQAMPWPAALTRALSPQAASVYAMADAARGVEPRAHVPLSIAPDLTLASALHWAAAAALVAVAAALGATGRRWVAPAVLAAAVVQMAVGRWGEPERQTLHAKFEGTFVNPNHQALFLSFGVAVAGAGLWWLLGRDSGAAWRRSGIAAAAALWLGLAAAIVLTGSRSGLVAVLACVIVQLLLVGAGAKNRRLRFAWLLVPAVLALVGLVALLPGELGARLAASGRLEPGIESRLLVWKASLGPLADYVVTGSGLGTYGEIFAGVRTGEITDLWLKPHNGPLELALTGGLGALVAAALALAFVGRRLVAVARHGTTLDSAAALAAAGALAAALAHECFDFGLSIPANTAGLAVLVGASCSAPLSRDPGLEGVPRSAT